MENSSLSKNTIVPYDVCYILLKLCANSAPKSPPRDDEEQFTVPSYPALITLLNLARTSKAFHSAFCDHKKTLVHDAVISLLGTDERIEKVVKLVENERRDLDWNPILHDLELARVEGESLDFDWIHKRTELRRSPRRFETVELSKVKIRERIRGEKSETNISTLIRACHFAMRLLMASEALSLFYSYKKKDTRPESVRRIRYKNLRDTDQMPGLSVKGTIWFEAVLFYATYGIRTRYKMHASKIPELMFKRWFPSDEEHFAVKVIHDFIRLQVDHYIGKGGLPFDPHHYQFDYNSAVDDRENFVPTPEEYHNFIQRYEDTKAYVGFCSNMVRQIKERNPDTFYTEDNFPFICAYSTSRLLQLRNGWKALGLIMNIWGSNNVSWDDVWKADTIGLAANFNSIAGSWVSFSNTLGDSEIISWEKSGFVNLWKVLDSRKTSALMDMALAVDSHFRFKKPNEEGDYWRAWRDKPADWSVFRFP